MESIWRLVQATPQRASGVNRLPLFLRACKESTVKHRILLSRPMPAPVEKAASGKFEVEIPNHVLTAEALADRAASFQAEGLLLSAALKLDADAIARFPPTMRIFATASAGFDHIDVHAARARGIAVTNAPVVAACTADLTLMHILAACRRAREYVTVMDAGWGRPLALNELLGARLSGRTLGIVGMGQIGQAVAQRARAFGMKIAYHSRRHVLSEDDKGATYFSSLAALLPHADVLSLHLPASKGAPPLIGAAEFALLPAGAVFVNTARGSLVNEDALISALESFHVAAAGLDVFQQEPHFNQQLLAFPRVFLTPHMGAATVETRAALGLRGLENIAAVLAGENVPDVVNRA